ncbi:MAG: TlpA disulfide reductase family protein [Nitrospiraceae bacterium]|nr:TlpA disulfide reductase family protein [Nitrospiraceae bacterium]
MGRKVLFAALILQLVLPLRLGALWPGCRTAYAIQSGQAAPQFTLEDTRGMPVSIAALKGKVIVLNFFAVWCPPCEGEITALNRLYARYRARGVLVLGVTRDSPGDVAAYEARRPIDYPVAIDARSTAYNLYDVFPVPVTFLIDQRGVIARKFIGPAAGGALEKAVERLLASKS